MRLKKPSGPVRLAIIGTGGMAHTHARNFKAIRGCSIVAAADIDPIRVRKFCDEFRIPAAYTDARELLAKSGCNAVTIVAPDAMHGPLALQCLKAGMHVLCEKPLALSYAQARRMVAAARKAGRVNMVNFSYRNWPCLDAVAALVRRGDIGEVRHVEASYLQCWLNSRIWGDWRTSPGWLWRLSSRHGSRGTLGDIGVHIVDFATYPVGPLSKVFCRLKTFHKAPRDRVGPYVLDANDSAVLTVEFANGAVGSIHATRWCAGHANRLFLKISGTRGAVEIDSDRSTTAYRICSGPDLDRAQWREKAAPAVPTVYSRFISSIRTGRARQPDFARGAEVQRILDACFKSDALERPVGIL
jgi:predicted dehydrogenase